MFSVYSWTVIDCYTIVWFRSGESSTRGAQRQQTPCSQIFEVGISEQWDHHVRQIADSADQRTSSPDDRVPSDTRAPHQRCNVARGERSWTGCVSRLAASGVHYGWRQRRCRTSEHPGSASQPSSGRIEVGREDIHSTRRGHRCNGRLGLWWRRARASSETLSLTTGEPFSNVADGSSRLGRACSPGAHE